MKLKSTVGKPARVRQEIDVLRWCSTLVTSTALLAVLIILLSTRWGAALSDDTRTSSRFAMRLEKQPSFFESKFTIRKQVELDEGEETRVLLSVLMMILLERACG